MGVKLRYNIFVQRTELFGFQDYSLLNDNAWAELWSTAREYGFQPSKLFLAEALEAIALQDKYHPVKEYFESLKWDGIKRLDRLLVDYAGAEDNEYVRAVGAKPLIAAVRRIYVPGTKFDTMPVLESTQQGAGKSSMLKTLAVREEWFADGVSLGERAKEMIEQVEGCLIVEIQELKGMRHSDVDNVKAQLSKTHDKARKAYGRFTTNLPRQFVLFATTNPGEKASYLKDKTGNRRFWPVRTSDEIDLASLERDRDQIWAEAVHRHRAGESLLLPRHLWDFARAEQEKRVAEHPWVVSLEDAFQDGDKPMLGKVRVEDVWALLGKREAPKSNYEMTDLGEAMRKLGWEHTRLRFGDKRAYCYVRGVAPHREITVITRFGEKPVIGYARGAAEGEF
jgi:predicted P-loop ATPase